MNFSALLKRALVKTASIALVLWGVVTLVFLLLHIAPGDPVEVMLGNHASIADRAALRTALHLDEPIIKQYARYGAGLLTGDWGQSLHQRAPVLDIITARLPATLLLAAVSMALALFMAIPLGVWAARYAGGWQDALAMNIAVLGVSIPNFVLGPLLIWVFAIGLNLLPTSGYGSPTSWVLPAVALGTAMAAVLARMIRANVLALADAPFLVAARARGLSRATQLWRYQWPNALLPVLTVFGLQFGTLLGGAVIVETVFAWPGLGTLLVESIERRDYPLVQGVVLCISGAYVAVNMATDLAYYWLDPRIATHG